MDEIQEQQLDVVKNVHITLVGSQASPVYNGIAFTSPDLVEFIYSIKTREVKDLIVKEINCTIADSEPLKEFDIQMIKNRAKSLREKYNDINVTLNISGGTKPWAYLFAQEFALHRKCTIICIDQNNLLWDFTTSTTRRLPISLDMAREFRLHGTPLASCKPLSEYSQADDETAKAVETLRRNSGYISFNKLFAVDDKNHSVTDLYEKIRNNSHGEYQNDETNAFISWNERMVDGIMCKEIRIQLFDQKSQPHDCVIASPHVLDLLFNSGWFEYKVAKALQNWKHAKNIWLNCIFRSQQGADKNEVDIIVNTGWKLLFVECKTKIHKPNEIDKFRTVVRNYGGLSCKSLFVTENVKSKLAQEKCRDSGILDVTLYNNEQALQYMYNQLDRELIKLNAI